MQQQVYQVHDVKELKQRLIDVWRCFEQSVINYTADESRKRLRVGFRVKEQNIEQLSSV